MKDKIAYLAPEIPALSSTFVTGELLEMEKLGFSVLPISVHRPQAPATGNEAKRLARVTCYLYEQSGVSLLFSHLRRLVTHPVRYALSIQLLMGDLFRVGPFSRIAAGLCYRWARASHLADILTANRCEHLHTHFAHIPTDLAMYASVMGHLPFSFTAHANDLFERGWLLKEKVNRAAFAATISDFNLQYLISRGAPEKSIHVIRCGVDPTLFEARPPKELATPPLLGTIGRMVEKKGFPLLIQACAILKRQGLTFHLEIAGDGPMKEALQQRVRELDLTAEVTFKGPLPHGEVPGWISGLDCFVLPCRRDADGDMDGIPVVLMEAMASGVPVISTSISGIPELIDDKKTGLLCEPGSHDALAEALKAMLNDPELRQRLSQNGRGKVEAEFHQGANASALARLIRRSSFSKPAPPKQRGTWAKPPRYIVISPVRDEEAYLPATIASLVSQTLLPAEYILVDDGSTDQTAAIIQKAAETAPFIRYVKRENRGERQVGPGVVEAFYDGYTAMGTAPCDFICKMDGDLTLGPTYFETLFELFRRDPYLGAASGKLFLDVGDGRRIEERITDESVLGGVLCLSKSCFDAIGGFTRQVMWDGITFHRCRMAGYRTRSFRHPELMITDHRIMGSSQKSIYHGRLRWGWGQYFMGTHPLYILAVGLYRMLERPYLLGGLLIVAGYIKGWITRTRQYDHPGFKASLHAWQLERLKLGERLERLPTPADPPAPNCPTARETADADPAP
ncbi:glycosyltransferase [Desulfoluna sp.]|uniref:glycosyltransferase n=1 Tax=Desulfoluna sp. TaxID=2045199 RepID=UPI002633185E|nr:glycosyltransferase [Desulfoluna sp.]